MRIVVLILSTVLLLAAAGAGLLGTSKSFKDAKKIDDVYKSAKTEIAAMAKDGNKDAQKMLDLGEATGRMRIGAVVLGLCALCALVLLVLNFTSKPVDYVAIAVVVAALLAMLLLPQYETGKYEGASARSISYVVAALAALGAAAAYGARKLRQA